MQTKYLILIIALGLGVYACTTDEPPTADLGEAYYPMIEGHWVEYELDSVVYDDFDDSKTTTLYDLRIEVGEEIIDGEGSKVRGDNPNNSTEFYNNWDYFYEQIGVSKIVNGNTFGDVIKVNQSDERNAIQHFVSTEYYAKDVGLIEKSLEAIIEDDGTLPKSQPVIDRPLGRRGFAVYYRITDWAQ